MTCTLRTALFSDHDAIDRLLEAAFDTMEEVHLIHALRDSGEIMQEQVMEFGNQLVGYAALSAMVEPVGWMCLAPVAVAPAFQGQGYGGKLTRRIAEVANTVGPEVVVLGEPSLYDAAGFSQKRAGNLTSPYPLEYTSLAGPGNNAPTETLRYPDAFGNLT